MDGCLQMNASFKPWSQDMESDGNSEGKWRRVLNRDTFRLRWGIPVLEGGSPGGQSPE